MNRRIAWPAAGGWPLIAAIAVPPMAFAVILALMLDDPPPTAQNLWVGATTFGPTSTASSTDVEVVHNALHDIGAHCLKSDPDLGVIASDVDLIIAFSRRYPVGRFPIDDETATASSLLLVTREAVTDCAPAEAERLDELRP